MKQTKILAVLMTVVLLFGICAAGSNMLINTLLPSSSAQQTDNDLAGLLEGLEIDTGNISGIINGILGAVEGTTSANDDDMSTITTIVQALLGGTQEGETTLDAIKDKLGDLGGTVTENELVQAIVSTLLGFDFSNFDMSMLTSNEFISALTENLGGLNLGSAQQGTTSVTAGTTQSAVITTAPSVSTTGSALITTTPSVSTTVPASDIPVITTQNQQTTSQIYLGNAGTIVENQSTENINTVPSVSVPTAPSAGDAQNQPDGTKSVVSPKMSVGVLVLLLSGISVVAVVMVLKKKS